ncbi:MAG: 5'-methylthioadenosine/S-adenosylhomocysteine nucleosidase [Nostoc sp.]|uniref:5'-methylthioadenosine/S-adenosylhomocysteine nucleosidase family protein n=1 Tax=Nostoc sp. TaxID=1180 RepID=UPI002FF6859C
MPNKKLSPKNIAGDTRLQQPATQQAVVNNAVHPKSPLTATYDNAEPGKATACVVILTAIEVEHLAVQAHLTELTEETHERGTVYTCGLFKAPNCDWNVAVAQIGAGNPGASSETERAIERFKPQVILFVGVAGGIKDVNVGDVIAATKIYTYDHGKVLANKTLPRPELGSVSYELKQRAMAEARKKEWQNRIRSEPQSDLPRRIPEAKVAPIAAGEKVIASRKAKIYKYLCEYYDDAIAVEMEGFGFLEAVARGNKTVSAIVIRGISDLLEGKAEFDAKGSQALAACHASAFAFELLAKLDGKATPGSVGEFVGTAQIPFYSTLPQGVVTLFVEPKESEFYLHAHLGEQEFVRQGVFDPQLAELYQIIDTNQKPEKVISDLINCNAYPKDHSECIIRQFLKWLQERRNSLSDIAKCLIIDDKTEFEIPWELLELDKTPLGAVLQTVRCRPLESETSPVDPGCKGRILLYAKPEYSELESFQPHKLSDFTDFLKNLQQPQSEFGLVFIDGSSFTEPLNIPTVYLKYSKLFKARSSVVFIGGQLLLDGTMILRFRNFLKAFVTYGAKGVVGTLKTIDANKAAIVVNSFFTEYQKDPTSTIPELLRRLRQQAVQRLEEEVFTDENGEFYLATFMHVYYGNPMTVMQLVPMEGSSNV